VRRFHPLTVPRAAVGARRAPALDTAGSRDPSLNKQPGAAQKVRVFAKIHDSTAQSLAPHASGWSSRHSRGGF